MARGLPIGRLVEGTALIGQGVRELRFREDSGANSFEERRFAHQYLTGVTLRIENAHILRKLRPDHLNRRKQVLVIRDNHSNIEAIVETICQQMGSDVDV